MIELSNPLLSELEDFDEFLNKVNSLLYDHKMISTFNKRYSILYNCTNSSYKKALLKLGFKHVFSYYGEFTNEKVNVLILEIDRQKNPWYKRIFNF